MDKIEFFKGEYFFLSNFYIIPILHEGYWYPSVEHSFQAAKTFDLNERFKFMCQDEINRSGHKFKQLISSEAKKEGRKLKLRSDWELIKYAVMLQQVLFKFIYNIELKQKLLNTGSSELIEGNTWGDKYWGKVSGEGKNNLGIILMKIRNMIVSPLFYRCNGCGFHNESKHTIYKCERCGEEICKYCGELLQEKLYCDKCYKIESGKHMIEG